MQGPIQVRQRPRAVDTSAPSQPAPASQPAPQGSIGQAGAVGYVRTRRVQYGEAYGGNELVLGESDTPVTIPMINVPAAKVRVSGSITQNLGDFNSARVEVSIEMPCLPEMSEVERVYQIVSGTVDDLLRRELALATGVGIT